jgi:hypothetical protein
MMPSTRTPVRRSGRFVAALAVVVLTIACACATTSAAPATVSSARHWAGNGNRVLGTVKLTTDSVVQWTSAGRSFTLSDRSGKLKVMGKAKAGQSFAVRRTYRLVRVRAKGRWTLTITPLPAPKKKK